MVINRLEVKYQILGYKEDKKFSLYSKYSLSGNASLSTER